MNVPNHSYPGDNYCNKFHRHYGLLKMSVEKNQSIVLLLRRYVIPATFAGLVDTCKALRPLAWMCTGLMVGATSNTCVSFELVRAVSALKIAQWQKNVDWIWLFSLTQITELVFDDGDTRDLQPAFQFFPPNLRKLQTGQHQVSDLRCLGKLQVLKFSSQFNSDVLFKDGTQLEVPDSLIILDMGRDFNKPVVYEDGRYWRLPHGLKVLRMSRKFFKPTVISSNAKWVLPDGLIELRLRGSHWYPTSCGTWDLPPSLMKLECSGETAIEYKSLKAIRFLDLWITPCTFHVIIPSGVKTLTLYATRKTHIYPGQLPQSLKRLCLRSVSVRGGLLAIPRGLQHLVIEDPWVLILDHPKNVLGKNLTRVFIRLERSIDVLDMSLPPNLEQLELGGVFNSPVICTTPLGEVKQLQLPKTLTHLGMSDVFNQPVLLEQGQWELPEALIFLRLCGSKIPEGYPKSIPRFWDWPTKRSVETWRRGFNQPVIKASNDGKTVTYWHIPESVLTLDLGWSFCQPLTVNGVSWPPLSFQHTKLFQ